MEARANVDNAQVAGASELETRRPQEGRAAPPPVPRLRNCFAALDDVEGDAHETGRQVAHARPRGVSRERTTTASSSSNKKHNKKEKKPAGGEEGGKGNEVDVVGQELPEMDDFAWYHVFHQVDNAAQLARLRLVRRRSWSVSAFPP
jgi:hypothetical protein